ncbi:hypothetical protein BJX64DRAFT_263369 [Aspergillus heterothallicus]
MSLNNALTLIQPYGLCRAPLPLFLLGSFVLHPCSFARRFLSLPPCRCYACHRSTICSRPGHSSIFVQREVGSAWPWSWELVRQSICISCELCPTSS